MDSFFAVSFLAFLTGICLVYFVLPKAARPYWLLVCSCLFYMYNPANAGFIVLLFACSAVTWVASHVIEHAKNKIVRRIFLVLPLLFCLGFLVYYKYSDLIGDAVRAMLPGLGASLGHTDILIPVGISYFTFAALGYVIDVYRGNQPAEKNFFLYMLFVSFFPCIVTGPIERAGNMIPQFRKPQPFDYARVSGGIFRILWGFFKKFVIANTIGSIVDAVYSNPRYITYGGPVLLLASLLYTYQLYCDFSAGCDVAVGAGAIFGIELTENFRRPLCACSFTDLWRRWHISLTGWFRDYLYIPLGGNRKGAFRQYLNQLIVFLVSGLWHGASLSMAVWGLLNGIYLCIGKATRDFRNRLARRIPVYRRRPVRRFIQVIITYLLFTSCIIFFRSSEIFEGSRGLSDAFYIYSHLFTGWQRPFDFPAAFGQTLVSIGLSLRTAVVLGISIFAVETLEAAPYPVNRTIRKVPVIIRWPLYYALLLAMLFFGSFANSGSIYGRF